MQSENPSVEKATVSHLRQRLSWGQAAVIVLLVMVLGLVVIIWQPFLLTPPILDLSLFLYFAFGLAWLPLLCIFVLFRPSGRLAIPVLLVIIGLIFFCVGIVLIGPIVPTSNVLFEIECEVISETQELIQYECISETMDMRFIFIVEGPPGSPFVWLISRRSESVKELPEQQSVRFNILNIC